MNEKIREQIALFRYGIIAPLVCGTCDPGISQHAFFQQASQRWYEDPKGRMVYVSKRSIQRWYYQYQKEGFDGLKPQRRSDYGKRRKLDSDMREQIQYLVDTYPKIPATLIYQHVCDHLTTTQGSVSLSSVTRWGKEVKKSKQEGSGNPLKRYELADINEVWCGDSSVGMYLPFEGKKRRTYMLALLDDASRMIVGADIFFQDTYVNVLQVMKQAMKRHGKPKRLNFDKGSSYKNEQMTLCAARIGTILHYNRPYNPGGKAKIERWFRTCKEQWMSTLHPQDIPDIETLRRSFYRYVQQYNQTVHSSLQGKTPQERFYQQGQQILRLPESKMETLFLLEIERKVMADSVIHIGGIEYEVPYQYAKQRIKLRYSPDFKDVYVVDMEGGGLEKIKLLNKQANADMRREKIRFSKEVPR